MSADLLNKAVAGIEIPDRVKRLPISPNGFPVPWFVHFGDDGVPDFRIIGSGKMARAVAQKACWICGETLGRNLTFVIGPMCAINRVISEPPSHLECAEFAARACPFLSKPNMRRNEKDMPEHYTEAAGVGLKRNPGVTCLWMCRDYKLFRVDNGVLFELGVPTAVRWYAEGRRATRAEVDASIASGMPALMKPAEEEGPEAVRALMRYIARAQVLLPAA